MRPKKGLDIEAAITDLAVGEALISLLDAKGRPSETERVFVLPPGSQLGPITAAQRLALLQSSLVAGVYETTVDRESAYEMIKGRAHGSDATSAGPHAGPGQDDPKPSAPASGGLMGSVSDLLFGSQGPRGAHRDGVAQLVLKSAVRTVGSSIGREIVRGVLGGLLGGASGKGRRR
jgi:hypothetical protein